MRCCLAAILFVLVLCDEVQGRFRHRYRSHSSVSVSVSVSVPSALPVPKVAPPAPSAPPGAGNDALDAVNAKRAARGLRPFVRDEGLTQAARACATHRATHLIFGHSRNDFGFVPAGTRCTATGCAAYPASYGFMACCVYENWTYAGAVSVLGRDGRMYHHLFVR